jgi:hypothetical protein
LNVKVANDGCCARKEEVTCMDESIDGVAYGSHPYEGAIEGEMLNKRLVKEAW